MCSKGANLGPARGYYAGRLAFPRKEANEPRLRRQWNPDDSTPKRENDTARGPFLGKGLPNGVGLADGNGPKGPTGFPDC